MTTLWTENVERWCISCFGFNQHRKNFAILHQVSSEWLDARFTCNLNHVPVYVYMYILHCTHICNLPMTVRLNFDVSTKYTSISYWHCNFESHSEAHYSNDERIIIIIDNIRSEICVVCHVCNLSPIEAMNVYGYAHMYCNIILYPYTCRTWTEVIQLYVTVCFSKVWLKWYTNFHVTSSSAKVSLNSKTIFPNAVLDCTNTANVFFIHSFKSVKCIVITICNQIK